MKKRAKIRLTIFAVALPVIFCGLWCDALGTLNRTALSLEYTYRRALNDLTDNVTGMRSLLQKAPYVNTSVMQGQFSAELLELTSAAKASMAALPISQEKTERISRFLSQAGDYALTLSRQSAAGISQGDSDFENLTSLCEYSEKLETALQNTQAAISAENATINQITSRLNNLSSAELPLLDDNFDHAAEELATFPSLLYDGPFSEHIAQREPLFLSDSDEVSLEYATQIAADFLSCQTDELTLTAEGGSAIAVYSFTHGDSHVNVTRLGGHIAYFKKAATAPTTKLSYDDALKSSVEILRDMGITDFTETYYVTNDNLCTINFAGTASLSDTQVICYPDLIKVTIELNAGGMVEYDATGYLMNKHERTISVPSVSAERAAESLSPRLTVKSTRLAIIPTPGLDEILCHEFLCTAQNGREFLVYINAETALEEQLYILQKSDNGILVV